MKAGCCGWHMLCHEHLRVRTREKGVSHHLLQLLPGINWHLFTTKRLFFLQVFMNSSFLSGDNTTSPHGFELRLNERERELHVPCSYCGGHKY